MQPSRRDQPTPVKHWSFAGLVLTYWCNAACASCYFCCGPARRGWMGVEDALRWWRGLVEASPSGCRIHLSGGEPFGDWPRLIEICRQAQQRGLGPLEKVETNAFWAVEADVVRDRLKALDAAGMRKLVISADPYHQQFVPIERCRLAARIAYEVLGPTRVQVRWRDWLTEGFDTDGLDDVRRSTLFARYAAAGRDRFNGRAAEVLALPLSRKAPEEFADNPCGQALLRSRHVHVDPDGRLVPGTCAGIVLGTVSGRSIAEIWQELVRDYAARPILARLAASGPAGLLQEALATGFAPQTAYVAKCHLCWDIRRWFADRRLHRDEIAPEWMYGMKGRNRP